MKNNIIIWDYDGTLVDTKEKNLNVLRTIVEKTLDKEYTSFKCLISIDKYTEADSKAANWRELYSREFGMNEKEIDIAGSLWTECQLADNTQCTFYTNLPDVIKELNQFKMGIVSQNSSDNIKLNLQKNNLQEYFDLIIGYEEVDYLKQKPHPEGLLKCIAELQSNGNTGKIFYIGDHKTDMQTAYNANELLNNNRIITIGAFYEKKVNTGHWKVKPNFTAFNPEDILRIVNI